MSEERITVNVQTGTGEILRIVATVLLFGGAGAVAWSVAQGQHAEIAATGMTLMIVMVAKLMYRRGLVRLPSTSGGEDFAATRGMIAQVSGEYQRWLAGTSMPALTLIAIAYALAFLLLRTAVSAAFSVFQNLWIAGGFAAIVGAIVVFPSLLPSILSSLKRKGVVTTPTEPATRLAPPPAPAAATSAPTEPATRLAPPPAPAAATSAAPLIQEAAPAPVHGQVPTSTPPRRVVRRVVTADAEGRDE
ncbi:hypothetical protein [Gordonia sp. NPDC057248]|uniref:hypothetical protein n=1 Tax=Gordonia sp. NPDC057248 TaxID=3346066 RepID=UPI003644EDA8